MFSRPPAQKAGCLHLVVREQGPRSSNGREDSRLRRHRLLAESLGADIHLPASLAGSRVVHGEKRARLGQDNRLPLDGDILEGGQIPDLHDLASVAGSEP